MQHYGLLGDYVGAIQGAIFMAITALLANQAWKTPADRSVEQGFVVDAPRGGLDGAGLQSELSFHPRDGEVSADGACSDRNCWPRWRTQLLAWG